MLPINNNSKTYNIIGAAMQVHQEIGCGFKERIYHEAFALQFQESHIPYEQEKPLFLDYKGTTLKNHFRVDFICYQSIIVEIKSIKELTNLETAQVLNYLKASKLEKALLINFGQESLQFKRLVMTHKKNKSQQTIFPTLQSNPTP